MQKINLRTMCYLLTIYIKRIRELIPGAREKIAQAERER